MKIIIKGSVLLLLFILPLQVSSQPDSSGIQLNIESLKAEDLRFTADTNRLQMISTGRISRYSDELPLFVYVVSHEDILKNQYTTLIDVLNSLPGIQTSKPGSGELGESFQIWGLTGNLYTKILINGLPIKPSVVSGMPIGSQLPVRQAEKIEIIYGNASAVYGADAVSGVINIITREADRGNFARGDVGLGKGGYNYMNFFIGGKGGRNNNILQYSFYGNKSEISRLNIDYPDEDVYNPLNYFQGTGQTFNLDGTVYSPHEITEQVLISHGISPADFMDEYYGENYEGTLTRPDMEDLGSSAHMMGLQLNFRGIGLSYNNMYRRTHSSIGLSPKFYKYNNPQNYWGDRIQRLSMGFSKDFENFISNTQLSFLAYNMDNNSSQGVTFIPGSDKVYRYSASRDMFFEQVFSASPAQNLEIVAGFSYNQSGNLPVTNYLESPFPRSMYVPFSEKTDYSDPILGKFGINPILYSNTSGFMQSYFIYKKFRILGSLRYDINTLYGNRFSPHIAFLHKTSARTSFRISTGTSYKAPPASLTYQSLAYPLSENEIYYLVVPNPDLKPENFNTLEIRMNTTIFKKFKLYQTLFLYQIHDHIIPVTLGTGDFNLPEAVNDSVRTWINNDRAVSNVFGSQTTLRVENLVQSIKMNAELSLTFQERQDKLPNVRDIVVEYFKLNPRHMGKLKISMEPFPGFYMYIESHWMTKWLRLLIPFESIYKEIFNESDGYYAMNVMTSYKISDNLNVFLKATNLFDEKYGGMNATFLEENLVYNPQLRRNISFGLSYKLN